MNRSAKEMKEVLQSHGVAMLGLAYQYLGCDCTGIIFQYDDRIYIRTRDYLTDALTGFKLFTEQKTIIPNADFMSYMRNRLAGRDGNCRTKLIRIESFYRVGCECEKEPSHILMLDYTNVRYVCPTCYIEKTGDCGKCHKLVLKDSLEELDGIKYCRECLKNGFFTCTCCGKRKPKESGNYSTICQKCIDEYYIYCYDCGCLRRREEAYELHDNMFCQDCYDNKKNRPMPYSYKPSAKFMLSSKEIAKHIKQKRFFGFELEVGMCPTDEKGVEIVNNELGKFIYCKDDGSIPDYGFEMVSHPCSMGFLDEHKAHMSQVFNKLSAMGYRSHDIPDAGCGLHVHVSRNCMERIDWVKLDFLVNNHPVFFKKIARRATRFGKTENKTFKDCGKNLNRDRYTSLNFLNTHTVEFRLFRGTLKIETFMATIQICDLLLDFVKAKSLADIMDYQKMETELAGAMLNGPEELKAYASRQNLFATALNAEGARSRGDNVRNLTTGNTFRRATGVTIPANALLNLN
jgi:hypothetical protein